MAENDKLRQDLLAAERRIHALEQQLKGQLGPASADELTGLWNAAYLEQQLPHELAYMKSGRLPLSLLLAAADFAPAGSPALLKDVALLLRDSARAADIVGRCGADEFLVILPEASKGEALALAKRFHTLLQPLRQNAGVPVGAGVSVGIAAYPVDGEEAADLFQHAVQALDMAKRRGGDQICVYAGTVGGRRKRVGEYLMELGVCTNEQMEEALRYCLEASQRGAYMAVGEALTKLGYATEAELERALKLQAQDQAGGGSPSQ